MPLIKKDINNFEGEHSMRITKSNKVVKANMEINATSNISADEQALQHIKAAIDILGKSGNKDSVTKDSIANLGVVMFDLKGRE